jgi:aminopeptidase N
VNLFTFPGRYAKGSLRERLYLLVRGLDRTKKINPDSPQVQKTRSELHALVEQIVPGYEYTGTTYREIAMQNSDYGGMENVGNTTITANRIMPYPFMTDSAYEYLATVKVLVYLNSSE